MGGGASEVLLLYIGGVRKVLLWGRGGGQEKFDGLHPSLFWVLNVCKNCMKFRNANIIYKFNVLETQ